MVEKYQEKLSLAAARDLAKAIDIELKLPRKGVSVGRGPHAPISAVYAPGAVGWTASECEIVPDPGSARALVVLTDAALAIGKKSVDIGGRSVVVDLTVGVLAVRPAKYKPRQLG